MTANELAVLNNAIGNLEFTKLGLGKLNGKDEALLERLKKRRAEVEASIKPKPEVDKQATKRKERRWKRNEDWVNERFGFKRLGHMRRGVSCPDGVNEIFSQDTTTTKGLKWLDRELSDAEAHAPQGRIPVVFAILTYKPKVEGIVAYRIKHFEELHGGK